MKAFRSSLLLACGAALTFSACVKQDFETPPDNSGYDPQLPVNISIRDLKAKNGAYSPNGTGDDTLMINEDLTASAVVIANDKSGNLYKQIVVQDSTGGIAINIDDYRLFAQYPVGRKIYIKLKGMMLSYNGGTPVLGSGVDERKQSLGLSGSKVTEHIIKANTGNTVKDTVISFDDARTYTIADEPLLNRLVTIKDVQFVDTNKTYTDPTATTNRNIQTCGNTTTTLTVRTSNYADFHGQMLPKGNGTITGVYTVYASNTSKTPQMLVRDTSDVKFYNPRCGSVVVPPTGTTFFTETFNSATTGEVALTGWSNIAEAGTKKWEHSNSGSTANPYAKMSAFNSNQPSVITWLITPAINLAGAVNPRLSFKSARGYDNGATLQLFGSTNYAGSPATATWVPLNFTMPASNAAGFSPFVSSGDISLTQFGSGNVWFAWKYVGGTTGDKTTTWELDDVKVTKD